MKKRTIIALLTGFCLITLGVIAFLHARGQSANKAELLSLTELPLSIEDIESVLPELNLSYTLREDERTKEMMPEKSSISLYNPGDDDFFVYEISSGQMDGERLVRVTFAPHTSPTALTKDDWKSVIALSTILYGGFESEDQVYNSFINEYGTLNTEETLYQHSSESRWRRSINGITCEIALERPSLDDAQEYLTTITLTSDYTTFFPTELN